MHTKKSAVFIYKYFPALMVLLCSITLSSTSDADSTCQQTPLNQSQEKIRFILNNLTTFYTLVGGGGITSIKQTATNTYIISISQEERIDQITYELETNKNCKISVLKRKISAISPYGKNSK